MYNRILVFLGSCIGMFFFGMAFLVMGAVLPALTLKYSLSPEQQAALTTAIPAGVLIGSFIFGPVVDNFGYRIIIIVSLLLIALGFEGLAFFSGMTEMWSSLFLIGFGGGMVNGCTNALVSEISNDKNRSSWLSILGSCFGIGALIIPLILGLLEDVYTYDQIIKVFGVFVALCSIYFMVINFPKNEAKQGASVKEMASMVTKPVLLLLSGCLFVQCSMEGIINNWTTIFLTETTDFSKSSVLFSLTILVLGITVSRLSLTFISRILNNAQILLLSLVLIGGGSALLMIAPTINISLVYGIVFFVGFGLATGFPIIISLVGTYFKNLTGTAIGIAIFIGQIGTTLATYIMGVFKGFQGIYSFQYLLLALIAIQVVIILSNKSIINPKIKG